MMSVQPPTERRAEWPAAPAITVDRVETRYLLDRAAVRSFARKAMRHLPEHRLAGEGANQPPHPQHFVTSVYFDSAKHTHLRAALSDVEHDVKILACEYYDLMPSVVEPATEPGQLLRHQPWVWFEVELRDQGHLRKVRFRLAKRDVPAFLRGEHPALDAVGPSGSSHGRAHGDEPRDATASELAGIVDYLRTLEEPLLASCIVSHRRLALQDLKGTLRITIDLEIGYFAAPSDLWARSHALVRGTFGAPAKLEPYALVEVSRVGRAPEWLGRELRRLRVQPQAYRKFVHAAEAVHGRP